MKIADIGTGTGFADPRAQCSSSSSNIQSISIWIADTALDQPFRIDGFDKSLEQCPVVELLPKACSVRRLDILQDLPADLNGEYDVINVRLIQGGLGDDPVPALRNFIAMLSTNFPDVPRVMFRKADRGLVIEPGGYLQWQEIDLRSLVVATAKAELKQSVMEELLKEVYAFDFGK